MASVGLTMIVKNEAEVIGRALDSVRPIVSYVLIADTGSSDGTQNIIRTWLGENHIPGAVIERPWVDFSYNRNEAIQALRAVPGIDYALTIDADEYLVFDPGFDAASFLRTLGDADGYKIEIRHGDTSYFRMQLFSNRLPFHFRQALHEYLVVPDGARVATLSGFHNHYTYDGARAKNPNKYLDDARLIEKALRTETDPGAIARYTFYLAQCYRDAGMPTEARDAYLRRTTMGHFVDEVGLSYLYAGRAMEQLGQMPELVLQVYLKGFETLPRRAEMLDAAVRLANRNGFHQQAYLLARAGLEVEKPAEGLFIDSSVYNWRMLDEFQVACCGTGRWDEAVEASERLLSEAKFPEIERARIERNAAWALERYDELSAPVPAA